MSGPLLTMSTQAICAHAAPVTYATGSTRVSAAGSPVVTLGDTGTIAGCPLNVSGAPSPCLTVQYVTSATRVRAEGRPVLLQSSSGLGMGAGPQGPVSHVAVQPRVRGT